jgi:hypothetical protein
MCSPLSQFICRVFFRMQKCDVQMRVRAGGSTLGGAASLLPLFSPDDCTCNIVVLRERERESEREKIIVTFSTLFAHQSQGGSEPIDAVINDGDAIACPHLSATR